MVQNMSIFLDAKLILLGLSINLFSTIPAQAQTIDSSQLDCEYVNPNAMVITSEGTKPVSMFCDFQEKTEQKFTEVEKPPLNTQTIPRPSLGNSYELNGNVCRNQGIDTICLTPQGATNLRWRM
ncbi:hypothetical protein NIES4074_64950 (plasmid) [Cylindrospermum sp. NIES-4074]|nr:hypothetical protein NIES4074_64950 [Cylindrospermum sp. NIES-4074]